MDPRLLAYYRAPAAPAPGPRGMDPRLLYAFHAPAAPGPAPTPPDLTGAGLGTFGGATALAPGVPGAPPGLLTFGGPTALAGTAAPDLMASVVAWLRADPAVVAALGDSDDTPKIWADETAPRNPDGSPITLPWLVYSEPSETVTRVMGGTHIGRGTFEVGVWAGTKIGARQLLDRVKRSVNAMTVPQPIGAVPDQLVFVRSQDNSGRPLPANAPGSAVTEFGRAMPFNYLITRTDT